MAFVAVNDVYGEAPAAYDTATPDVLVTSVVAAVAGFTTRTAFGFRLNPFTVIKFATPVALYMTEYLPLALRILLSFKPLLVRIGVWIALMYGTTSMR